MIRVFIYVCTVLFCGAVLLWWGALATCRGQSGSNIGRVNEKGVILGSHISTSLELLLHYSAVQSTTTLSMFNLYSLGLLLVLGTCCECSAGDSFSGNITFFPSL